MLMKGLIIMYKTQFTISNLMLSMTISIPDKPNSKNQKYIK